MLNKLEQIRNSRKSGDAGFTIIEVMIVLAIAGLILLIVLLAIPALQRNSRNTQIKNDAANVVGGVSTFSSDNDGAIPSSIVVDPVGSGTVVISRGTLETKISIQKGTELNTTIPATGTKPTSVTPGTLTAWIGHSCDEGTTTAVARSVSVFYSVETTGGAVVKCVSS